jgi:SAM-dependent methyltransferase
MAHPEQHGFFREASHRFSEQFDNATKILEVGSQNINGTVRDFFPNAAEYLGIDLGQGLCVDWVVPGELIELPDRWADIVISTECFEHCREWHKVFINMIRISKPGGLILVTCAGIGRSTHGTIDSELGSSPFTPSYYKNLGIDNISSKIATGLYFSRHSFEINSSTKDLYFWGIRSDSDIHSRDHYWEEPMSRLARAQGQLGQAAARHASIQVELTQARNEAEKAKAEAERAKAEKRQLAENLRSIKESKTWRIAAILRMPLDSTNRFPRT